MTGTGSDLAGSNAGFGRGLPISSAATNIRVDDIFRHLVTELALDSEPDGRAFIS
jgi:hypothetical protein